MKERWIRRFVTKIRDRSTFFWEGGGGFRQSRKIRGMLTTENEICGFRSLFIYIEKGLAYKSDTIAHVINQLDSLMQEAGHRQYNRFLCSFNWEDGKIHTTKESNFPFSGFIYPNWKGWVIAVSGSEASLKPVLLPDSLIIKDSMFHHRPGCLDMIVFFCKDKSLFATPRGFKKYCMLRRCIAWVFLETGTEDPEWSVGKFIPKKHDNSDVGENIAEALSG